MRRYRMADEDTDRVGMGHPLTPPSEVPLRHVDPVDASHRLLFQLPRGVTYSPNGLRHDIAGSSSGDQGDLVCLADLAVCKDQDCSRGGSSLPLSGTLAKLGRWRSLSSLRVTGVPLEPAGGRRARSLGASRTFRGCSCLLAFGLNRTRECPLPWTRIVPYFEKWNRVELQSVTIVEAT
jgi:hypothetical protein